MDEDRSNEERRFALLWVPYHIALVQHLGLVFRLTDTQGELQDRGAFTRVHAGLLLPDHYTILGIYLKPYQMVWDILLTSPSFPVTPDTECIPVLILREHVNEGEEENRVSYTISLDNQVLFSYALPIVIEDAEKE